jgi:hypothetical protein
MSLTKHILKLKIMDDLIRRRSTGSQHAFCKKLSMSRSLLNNYLSEMKLLGFPIQFDRKRNSYFYKEEGKLVKCLFEKKLSDHDSNAIKGGAGYLSVISATEKVLPINEIYSVHLFWTQTV